MTREQVFFGALALVVLLVAVGTVQKRKRYREQLWENLEAARENGTLQSWVDLDPAALGGQGGGSVRSVVAVASGGVGGAGGGITPRHIHEWQGAGAAFNDVEAHGGLISEAVGESRAGGYAILHLVQGRDCMRIRIAAEDRIPTPPVEISVRGARWLLVAMPDEPDGHDWVEAVYAFSGYDAAFERGDRL